MKKNLTRVLKVTIICALALMLNVTAFAAGNTTEVTLKYDNSADSIISNSGKISHTPANTVDFFPDRSFVSVN